MSDRVIFFLDRAELFFLRTQGWVSFVNFPRVFKSTSPITENGYEKWIRKLYLQHEYQHER